METQRAITLTRLWVERLVVGLNLCPFASRVVDENSLRLQVCEAEEDEGILRALLMELDFLHGQPEEKVSTSLLIFSQGLRNFDHYLAVLEEAQQLLVDVGLEGVFQLASFHPDYCFDGVDQEDLGNYSNRSPLPMFHFIREAQLDRVLADYPAPEEIPENNIRTLHALGEAAIMQLYSGLKP